MRDTIHMLILPQSLVSLRRIEKYLHGAEVASVPPLGDDLPPVAFQGATVTWPQDRTRSRTGNTSATPSAAATPKNKFILMDLNLVFPKGELSLVCGKLGSGKTLLLLGACRTCGSLHFRMLIPLIFRAHSATWRGGFPHGTSSLPEDAAGCYVRVCRCSCQAGGLGC